MKSADSVRRVLITGEMRSGTTLLANLLNSQPNITIYRDFLHIERLYQTVGLPSLRSRLSESDKRELFHLLNKNRSRLGILSESRLQVDCCESLLEFYTAVLDRLREPGDVVVGHKTTCAHGIVRELLTLLPDLRVLYLIRDPRDVVTSAINHFPGIGPCRFIEGWRDAWNTIHALKRERKLNSRLMLLRYEDLVLDSERALARTADFFACDKIVVPEKMTDYGREWQDNSSFGDLSRILDPSPIGRWRVENPRIGTLAGILLQDSMEAAGYEAPEPRDKLLRVLAKVSWIWVAMTDLIARCWQQSHRGPRVADASVPRRAKIGDLLKAVYGLILKR